MVQAIGIGNIVIHQAPNRTLTLYNALHIPDAGVWLISISALWQYSQHKMDLSAVWSQIMMSSLPVLLITKLAYMTLIYQKPVTQHMLLPHPLLLKPGITAWATPTISASKTWLERAWSKVFPLPSPISPLLNVCPVFLENRRGPQYQRSVRRDGGQLDD